MDRCSWLKHGESLLSAPEVLYYREKHIFKETYKPNQTKPVVTIADLIAAGDQVGCEFLRSATIPAITGVAIDVPE